MSDKQTFLVDVPSSQKCVKVSGKTSKLPSWRAQGNPLDSDEELAYQRLIVRAVFSIWNVEGRPSSLLEIYRKVVEFRTEKIGADDWPFRSFRSKRTIDRQVNKCASLKNAFGLEVPKICAVTSGVYQPNPKLFKN